MFRQRARSAELFVGAVAIVASLAPAAPNASAASFAFFGERDLDYWNEGKTVRPFFPHATQRDRPADDVAPSSIRAGDGKPFSWKDYAEPASLLFWDDGGDWVPPRPFREAAANPTPENLERYLDWQERKMAVVGRFQEALVAAGMSTGDVRHLQTNSVGRESKAASPKLNWKAVDLIYFYQSSCPHCQAARPVVEDLGRKGVRVSFVQLDADRNPPLHTGSIPYNAAFERQFHITSTPTWAFRLGGRTRLITGEVSLQQIESELTSTLSEEKK